jgi:hypothetical protein
VPLDADGYPTGIPAGVRGLRVSIAIVPQPDKAVDSYVMTYRGDGNIALRGARVQNAAPGRITFAVERSDQAGVKIEVTGLNPQNPLHDIHVVRADQTALFDRGEVFNPAFVQMVSHFAALRFMDWGETNTMVPVSWAARPKLTAASWANGVPVEIMVRLANEAHADMWYNVPTLADDAFVRSAMTYIRDNLAPDRRVHVEFSNEVWNWRFAASHWAQAQAAKMWGPTEADCKAAERDADAEDCTPAVQPNGRRGWMTFYGYRAAQVQAVAHQVFGAQAGKRLAGVLGAGLRQTGIVSQELNGVRLANVGKIDDLFSEYAVATYFGLRTRKNAEVTIKEWAQSGAGGLDAAFKELEFGGSLPGDLSIASVAQAAARHQKIAHDNGLRMVAYEGGIDLSTRRTDEDDQKILTEFYDRLVADPRMGAIYEKMAGAFAAQGGTLLLNYYDVSPGSKYGYWGVLDSIYQTSSPRYDALVRVAARARAAGGGSAVAAR